MKVNIGEYNTDGSAQSSSVSIDKWDTWSLDYTLARIIHPALVKFREVVNGYPAEFDVNADGEYTEAKDDTGLDAWKTVLDKIIWSFGAILDNDGEDQFYSGLSDISFEPCNDGTDNSVLVRGPNDTAKVDTVGLEVYHKKIQEGLDLFGKYYRHLWT